MKKLNKTLAQLKQEKIEKYHTRCYQFSDFPKDTRVRIITPICDFQFFYDETGVVVANSGRYLGIEVCLDESRQYENGTITTNFNFNPIDLVVLEKFAGEVKEISEAKKNKRLARFYKWADTLTDSYEVNIHGQTGWLGAMKEVLNIIKTKEMPLLLDGRTLYRKFNLQVLEDILREEIGEE